MGTLQIKEQIQRWSRPLCQAIFYLLTARYALPRRYREPLFLIGLSEQDISDMLGRIRTVAQWKDRWQTYAFTLLEQAGPLAAIDTVQTAPLLKRAAAGLYLSQLLLPWGSPEKEKLLWMARDAYKRYVALQKNAITPVCVKAGGQEIAGYLEFPKASQGPGVLILPPIGATKEEMTVLSEAFVQAGFVALRVDLPGSGDSSGPLTLDTEKFCCTAIDYLLARPEVTSTKVVMVGISFGAYWMVKTMAVDDRVAGGVGISIPAFHQGEWDRLKRSYWLRLQQCFKQPTIDATKPLAIQMTLYGVINIVKSPLLAFHGGRDTVSHPETARLIRENVGGPLELHVYRRERHGCLGKLRTEIIPRTLVWSAQRLAGCLKPITQVHAV